MSTSKFLKDICRSVGCDGERICQRCGNVDERNWMRLLEGVLSTTNMDEEFDDLDQIEMVMAAEEEYDIEIPDEETDKLKTPRQCLAYLRKRFAYA